MKKYYLDKIKEAINERELDAFGIRCDVRELEEKEELENSHMCFQDDPTIENPDGDYEFIEAISCWMDMDWELRGTCAVRIEDVESEESIVEAIKKSDLYKFENHHMYLIGGSDFCKGEDQYEIIIEKCRS